ncbi:DUF4047 domain-containing protein [Microbacteriaceae bacterium 4G12]
MGKTPAKRIGKAVMLSCLCSMSFYASSQLVSHTKASFSDSQKVQAPITAAFVFPKAVEKDVTDAKALSDKMSAAYSSIVQASLELTLPQAKAKLNEVTQQRDQLVQDKAALKAIYDKVDGYNKQAAAQEEQEKQQDKQNVRNHNKLVIDYVKPSFLTVQQLYKDVDSNIDLQKVEQVRKALQDKINALQEKSTSPSSNDKVSSPSAPKTDSGKADSVNSAPAKPAAPQPEQNKDSQATVDSSKQKEQPASNDAKVDESPAVKSAQ